MIARSQRERLLEAAVRVVAEKGYAATTVADLTREAGISRTTFYGMFEDKEGCFLAAYDGIIDALVRRVTAAYEAEVAVLAAYDAAMRSAGPTAQALIAPLRDDHQRHLATLGRGSSRALVISPTSSRDLAEAERTSATLLASAAASAPDGAIAALLASIAASHRAHHAHLSAEPFRW